MGFPEEDLLKQSGWIAGAKLYTRIRVAPIPFANHHDLFIANSTDITKITSHLNEIINKTDSALFNKPKLHNFVPSADNGYDEREPDVTARLTLRHTNKM